MKGEQAMTVRLPLETHAELKRIAAERGCPMSYLLRVAVERLVADRRALMKLRQAVDEPRPPN